jgi:hypothetical protein
MLSQQFWYSRGHEINEANHPWYVFLKNNRKGT